MSLAPVTVATLRAKLADLPDDAAVVLFDEREHTITRVIDHLTHDKHSNAVVLHLEEAWAVRLRVAIPSPCRRRTPKSPATSTSAFAPLDRSRRRHQWERCASPR